MEGVTDAKSVLGRNHFSRFSTHAMKHPGTSAGDGIQSLQPFPKNLSAYSVKKGVGGFLSALSTPLNMAPGTSQTSSFDFAAIC